MDWRWRIGRYGSGAGASVSAALTAARQDDRRLRRSLLLFDAALHARRVQCPVLCKLAGRDDVVPAPAAAAVFNALPDGQKWRFLARYGHFDGGLADARRHGQFERVSRFFLNFSRSPEDAFDGRADGFEL